MADEQQIKATPIRTAILSLNPKFVLAFFLIIVAALLVVFFILIVTQRPPGTTPLDAGTVAVIVGLITTFVLMAKSASDYQFSSSAGSDKKDDAQTAVSKALAEKVPVPAVTLASVTPVAPTTDMLGTSMLSNGQLTYFKTLTDDEAKKAFLAMSAEERAATIAKVGT